MSSPSAATLMRKRTTNTNPIGKTGESFPGSVAPLRIVAVKGMTEKGYFGSMAFCEWARTLKFPSLNIVRFSLILLTFIS